MPRENKYTNWQQINWKDVMVKVAMLQDKIVKATRAKNMNLVFKLQRQLINCIEGRALAVRNVVSNNGGGTAGIDNITWETPADRFQAIAWLKEVVSNPKGYKSMPLRRIMIPKMNSDELRPLGIPTMKDRAVQAVYHLAVDPVVETNSDLGSFGFRKGRSQHDAITQLRNGLDKIHSPKYILEADIAKCFDKISHEFLLKNTPICDKHVLNEWLKSGYFFEGRYHTTTEGTPQGGIISPMLCNVALNGLEPLIRSKYPTNKFVKTGTPKVYVIRYADDIVVTGRNPEILLEVKTLISHFLKERSL
jgi:RNA-directed DNA polymerase